VSETREVVEVVEGEHVVERGTSEITWFVRQNDGWVHVSEIPGVEIARLDASPGTVWQSQVTLALPRGTRLMRVESRPSPGRRREVFEHLSSASKSAPRRVQRRYFRVGRAGSLEPDR
jgi:hypothetical protein